MPYFEMPIVDLYGHRDLRNRLARSVAAGSLPGSLLLHGPPGVGKQRLALWLGQLLLCSADQKPCGVCKSCEYARNLTHPDLHWYFPRPRPREGDRDPESVRDDYREAIADRLESHGLYPPASGSEGIFVSTVRAIGREAALSPAIAQRKVFLVGDAERMVPQEGSEEAANAFLKLLEEPLPDTTMIITSSEPGALLPTIRSRAVAVRVPLVAAAEVRAFVVDPLVAPALDELGLPSSVPERVMLAAGAPGLLLAGDSVRKAAAAATRLLDAARSDAPAWKYSAALAVGAAGARGAFSDTLDALLTLLRERMHAAVANADEAAALAASKGADAVLRARERANGNVNPQLITSRLLRELQGVR